MLLMLTVGHVPIFRSCLAVNGVVQVTSPAISAVQTPTLKVATVAGHRPGLRGKQNTGGKPVAYAQDVT